jgi:hypothetical protein
MAVSRLRTLVPRVTARRRVSLFQRFTSHLSMYYSFATWYGYELDA